MSCTNFDICTLNDTLISLVASFMDCLQLSPEYLSFSMDWVQNRISWWSIQRRNWNKRFKEASVSLTRQPRKTSRYWHLWLEESYSLYRRVLWVSSDSHCMTFFPFFIGRPSGILSVNSLMKINSGYFDSQQVTPLPLYDRGPLPISSSVVDLTIWRVQKDDTFPFVLVRLSPILWIKTH